MFTRKLLPKLLLPVGHMIPVDTSPYVYNTALGRPVTEPTVLKHFKGHINIVVKYKYVHATTDTATLG